MKTRWPIVGLIAGGVAIAGVIVGLSSQGTQVGMGLPTVDLLDEGAFIARPTNGTLHVASNGCFVVDVGDGPLFAIWPDGYHHGGDVVIDGDGAELGEGASVSGSIARGSRTQVVAAADGPNGYMDMATDFCGDDDHDVLILQSLG